MHQQNGDGHPYRQFPKVVSSSKTSKFKPNMTQEIDVEIDASFFVVIDTNLLVYELDLLHSPLGLALLSAVRFKIGYIVLPESLEREVVKHSVSRLRTSFVKLKAQAENLTALGCAISAPSIAEHELHRLVERRIGSWGNVLLRTPTTGDQIRRAHNRVLGDCAPNSPGSQQYKDSLVWEAVVDLAQIAPVFFVSKDKAFYDPKDHARGLALELQAEAARFPNLITLHANLESVLNSLNVARVDIDRPTLLDHLDQELNVLIRSEIPDELATLGNRTDHATIVAFNTDDPKVIAVQFQLMFEAVGSDPDEGRVRGHLHTFGACLATLPSFDLSRIQIHHVDFSSPAIGGGRIWRRLCDVVGDDGPLPVYNPPAVIVKKKIPGGNGGREGR
ncbi:MAG TPA: PIN domain-containing protein [Lacipirellulaceae bacterium]|nr:PIN domain-containing protein [Lacipirellulaceae bacterium]HMP04932.1 PIN domain-containing protein [Lacipirellulaceae bacterium]